MTDNTFSTLPREVGEALLRLEPYYSRVIDWLLGMYDHKTGGFYMTASGRDDPEMEPAIEMTAWGVSFLRNYTRALDTMPDIFRERVVAFMKERQDPVSGLFIDKQGPTNPRETARNQAAALGMLSAFGEPTRYPHPRNTKEKTATSAVMPEYMASVDSYIGWVSGLNWDKASWSAGDQTQSSLQYVGMLAPELREEYKTALIEFLEKRQQPSGLWSPNMDFNAVSGAFKVGLIYSSYGLKLPNYDRIIESVFECYRVAKPTNPFFVRNPISVLNQMKSYSPEAKAAVQEGVLENIDAIAESFGEFLCPDGAFSAAKGRSMRSFGGVVGSHELFEGDIDATLMMLIARKTLYSIFDREAPALDTAGFWERLFPEANDQ